MSDSVAREPSAERNVRSPSFEVPEYHITFEEDGTLQWTPPAASKELALALSYHFPKQKNLEDKMQAAIRHFLRASKKRSAQAQQDKGSSAIAEADSKKPEPTPSDSLIPPSAVLTTQKVTPANTLVKHDHVGATPVSKSVLRTGSLSSGMSQVVWKADTGEDIQLKPKKRQYTERERKDVGNNRGKVCKEHRQKKQKVSDFVRHMAIHSK
jgi:hypothetical protein